MSDLGTRRHPYTSLVALAVVNAGYTLGIQALALTSLSGARYGAFSIQYLMFALAVSVTFAVVCEASLRAEVQGRRVASWEDYSGVLVHLGLLFGCATVAVSLCVPALRSASLPGAVAVAASSYRVGARFQAVHDGRYRRVVAADAAGFVVAVVAWVVVPGHQRENVDVVAAIWAASAVAVAALSSRPHLRHPRLIRSWARDHRAEIRPLLPESALQYVENVATPYAIAPMLGLQSFATYRAASNVAAPIRFVLMPLRPVMGSLRVERLRESRLAIVNLAVGAMFGLACFAGLAAIDHYSWDLGVLNALVEYAFPTSLFVAANYLNTFYYVVARTHVPGRTLLRARATQTALVTIPPLLGVLLAGLDGAMWSFSIANVVCAGLWAAVVVASGADDMAAEAAVTAEDLPGVD